MMMQAAFHGAKFLNNIAAQCASLMCRGEHRKNNIPDVVIMECFGSITEGHAMQLKFETDEGSGYIAEINNYADLLAFLKGTLEVALLEKVDEPQGQPD